MLYQFSRTNHAILQADCLEVLAQLPSNSVDLAICDPPYNICIRAWDKFFDYLDWAQQWLIEVERVLKPSGNLVLFGGFQYKRKALGGDFLTLLQDIRHRRSLHLINIIVWNYSSGVSNDKFFASRHEEIAWFSKSTDYYFDVNAVREPYSEKTKAEYLRDKRLKPRTIALGKNPTNVWRIPRLNQNSKDRVGHPTSKPPKLIRRIIRSLCPERGNVLDIFAGSCITLRVAIEENRHSIICDKSRSTQHYASAQLKRLHHSIPGYRTQRKLYSWHPIFSVENVEEPKAQLPNSGIGFMAKTSKETIVDRLIGDLFETLATYDIRGAEALTAVSGALMKRAYHHGKCENVIDTMNEHYQVKDQPLTDTRGYPNISRAMAEGVKRLRVNNYTYRAIAKYCHREWIGDWSPADNQLIGEFIVRECESILGDKFDLAFEVWQDTRRPKMLIMPGEHHTVHCDASKPRGTPRWSVKNPNGDTVSEGFEKKIQATIEAKKLDGYKRLEA